MADDLRQRTAKGFVWGLVNQGSMQALNLAFGIVLGRLLCAEDYGIVGVLAVFSMIATNLQSCGFAQGLINLEKPEHRDYNSVFWFNVSVSAAIYAVLFLSAPLIVWLFDEPRLLWVSRFVFLGFLIASTGIANGAYMTKHLMLKESAIINFVALLCSGAVGIALAFLGFSYWSLAWQQIIFITVSMIGRYVVAPFRPSLDISFDPVKRMFRFSVNIMFTTFVTSISTNLLTFIFGCRLPMAQVGNYSQANKWSVTAMDTVRGVVLGIAQPVLKEVSDDNERTLRVLRKLMRFTSFVTFPALFGLALVSEEFIVVSIGERWLPSAELLFLLAIGGSVMPLYSLLQNLIISRGQSRLYLRINIVQVTLQLCVALVAMQFGMYCAVLSLTVYNILFFFVWHRSIRRVTGYSLTALLRDTMPFALSAAATMAITWLITAGPMLLLLFERIAVAAIIYVCILRLIKAEELNEAIDYLKSKRKSHTL